MAEVICGIYGIRNENIFSNDYGKMYVGQSGDIYTRGRKHLDEVLYLNRRPHLKLYKGIRKDNLKNFKLYILEVCEPSELNEKEMQWIRYYDSYLNGYNMTEGGDFKQNGVNNPMAKLNTFSLKEVIHLIKNTETPFKNIAERYGVYINTITDINWGRRYRLDGMEYPLRNTVMELPKNFCKKCGKEISKFGNGTTCNGCYKGENVVNAKLTNNQVLEIKQRLKEDEFSTFKKMAKEYGVSPSVISAINTGRSYASVGEYRYPIW